MNISQEDLQTARRNMSTREGVMSVIEWHFVNGRFGRMMVTSAVKMVNWRSAESFGYAISKLDINAKFCVTIHPERGESVTIPVSAEVVSAMVDEGVAFITREGIVRPVKGNDQRSVCWWAE